MPGATEGLPRQQGEGLQPSPQPLNNRSSFPRGLIPWEPDPPCRVRKNPLASPRNGGAGQHRALQELPWGTKPHRGIGAKGSPQSTQPAQNPAPSLGKPGWVHLSSPLRQQRQSLGLGSAVPSPGEGLTPWEGDPAPPCIRGAPVGSPFPRTPVGWGWLSPRPASVAAPALSCCQIGAEGRLQGGRRAEPQPQHRGSAAPSPLGAPNAEGASQTLLWLCEGRGTQLSPAWGRCPCQRTSPAP